MAIIFNKRRTSVPSVVNIGSATQQPPKKITISKFILYEWTATPAQGYCLAPRDSQLDIYTIDSSGEEAFYGAITSRYNSDRSYTKAFTKEPFTHLRTLKIKPKVYEAVCLISATHAKTSLNIQSKTELNLLDKNSITRQLVSLRLASKLKIISGTIQNKESEPYDNSETFKHIPTLRRMLEKIHGPNSPHLLPKPYLELVHR